MWLSWTSLGYYLRIGRKELRKITKYSKIASLLSGAEKTSNMRQWCHSLDRHIRNVPKRRCNHIW
jgi:hypothetical protein